MPAQAIAIQDKPQLPSSLHARYRLSLFTTRPAGRIKQQETTMKKIMTTIAVALSLLGSVNFALAQSNPDLGAVSGSTANLNAEAHDGEYHIQRGE
jgi:hypothetical protein